MAKFNVGDTVYLVVSNRMIREVLIVKYSGGFYTIRFNDSGASKEEAENAIEKAHPKQKSTWTRWDL